MFRKTLSKYVSRLKHAAVGILFVGTQALVPLVNAGIFTAHAAAVPSCIVDTAGANDLSGQKDLTKLCVDYANVPVSVDTTWNWDETGTNGANTLDACNLFDTDGDGNINYAVCVSTQNDPATLQSFTTYSCGDSKSDRCTSPNPPVSSGTTSCAVSQVVNDPFPSGSSSPKDTQGACTVDLTSVGGASAKLIDVCSYPSGQPNSDPSDCVIAQPKAGKLEVKKNLVPSTDSGLFNLQIDGTTKVSNVGNNGTTGEVVLPIGNHTVGETAGNTPLSGYTSSISCRDLNGNGSVIASGNGTSLANVPIADAADVVCTITNTASGSITIVKDAVPNDPQNFSFTATGTGVSNFLLDDDSDPTLLNTKTFSSLGAGTYSFTEAATSGWDLSTINCSGGSTSVSGATVTVNLTAGQNITCTYTNTSKGHLVVEKTTLPAADPTNFGITASGTGTITGGGAGTVSDAADQTYEVTPGTYSVSETVPSGWSKTGDTCQNVVIAAGATVHCTLTNTKLAKLKIVKATDPTSSSQPFSFGATGPSITQANSGFVLDTNAGDNTLPNNFQYQNLTPGTYTVTETEPGGWLLTNLVCTGVTYNWNGTTQTLSVTVAAGADITCTFTNTQLTSISGFKYEVNADSSTVGPKANWTIFLLKNNQVVGQTNTDANGNYSFMNLLPGSYSLSEQQQNGWTQIYGAGNVNLSAGVASSNNNFGNFQNATISGSKFNDLNGNANWDGGEPGLSGWTITLFDNGGSGPLLNHQVAQTVTGGGGNYSFGNLAPGAYKVCETQQVGWSQTYPDNTGCQVVTVALSGHDYTHTDFGNQGRGTITVVKNVDTDGNGSVDFQDVTNWNWNVDGSGNFTTGSGNAQTVAAGNHTVSEVQKTDYHVSASSCSGEATPNQPTTNVSVNLSPGENITCTFTNTRDTGSLNLIKHVLNDNGGTAVASDFTLHLLKNGVDVAGSPAVGSESGTLYSEVTGTYTVSENTPLAGYQQTTIICDGQVTATVTITTGTTKTCTITNDDLAPQVTVIKHVINDNSGDSDASDFTMQVSGTNVSNPSFPGSENGTTVNVNAGNYSVDEGSHTGYTETKSADCNGTIALGQTKVCTITNNDIAHPHIHVVKTGPATAHEGDHITYTFTVTNTGDTTLSGTTVSDNVAGNATYQSGDTNHDGVLQQSETWIFTASYTIPTPQVSNVVNTAKACANDPDQTQACDTDNHDLDVLHPSIFVTKDGPAYGYEGQIIGYTFVVTNTGDVTLHNVGIDDNIANLEHCDDSVLAPTASTNCTASFLIPTPQTANVVNVVTASGTDTLGATVTANADHTLDVLHPAIHVVKTGPAIAHVGDKVTYTFTVTNTGDIALSSLTVKDNIADNGVYQSGDTNNNGLLDLSETWIYKADYTIPADQTADVINTVSACGLDPIQATVNLPLPTCDTDEHHLDVLHPAIHVVKSGPSNAYQGDGVTYTFTVTNTGDTPLGGLTVGDDIAGTGVYQSGDTNGDNQLDPGETWIYTADYTVPTTSDTTISNIVKACGTDSLNKQACDTDSHNLHIYHPTITVNKVVVTSQNSDSGLFNLQIDGQTAGTGGNVGNGGTTGAIEVTPGSHNLGEAAGTDTDLADYDQDMSKSCNDGTVTITGDEHLVCTITNTRLGSVTIVKDAQPDNTQAFTFASNLTDDDTNFQLTDDGVNPGLASRTFTRLTPGTYNVTESVVSGWDLSNLTCSSEQDINTSDRNVAIQLEAGQNVTCTFTNQKRATVIVTKFNDYNLNGQYDPQGNPAEPALPGWDMMVDQTSQTTGADGTTTFTDVKPGLHSLSEVQQDDWNLSNIYCDNEHGDDRGQIVHEGDDDEYYLYADPGATIHCYVGNYQDAVLNLTKANNRPDPTVDGDTVTYTLMVTVPEDSGAIFDANVTDLPPANFTYVPGSWTASSSVRGDLKAGDITGEPTYGSPGIWHLGTLLPGEIVTLTYKALIGGTVSNGTYPDLAFVGGTNAPGGSRVLGNVSLASTPFVGTQVSVASTIPPKAFSAGQVVGPEVLVNTGTNLLLAQFVLPILLVGGVIIVRRSAHQGKGTK
jgi:uncharacterized repeat protein (TIGR01451 family)